MPSPADLTVDVIVSADADVPAGVTEEAIASLARHVLAAEGASGDWQFGVQFIDDRAMQQAHADFMGIDTPTDIMTFPYEDDGFDLTPEVGDEMAERGGDLMISVDRAAAHAEEAGWTTGQELWFLVIHGILHILGWDDATDVDRGRMLDRQAELLASWPGKE